MLALLAGCDDPAPRADAPATVPEGRAATAQRAAEERLRARLRREGPLTLRAMQAYRQAMPDTIAICGQVNPGGQRNEPFLPFVAVVAFQGDAAGEVEFHLAASSPEATRVYYEMVDRCFDGGGPAHARTAVRPLPPAPSVDPSVVFSATPAPAPAPATQAPAGSGILEPGPQRLPSPAPAGGTAIGTVSVRSPANVRSSPSGGGEVLRVAPRGATLDIFAEAPGGWYQVGEGEPWGWVHGSLLDR